ncbi:MAG: ATP-binding protein [Gemmatimonadales bacterium]
MLAGLLVQLAVTVLIAVLMATMAARRPGRQYRSLWAIGWWALVAALTVVAIRHDMFPWLFDGSFRGGGATPARLTLHLVYQVGKLLFLAFVALGAISYGRRPVSSRVVWLVAAVAVLLGATGWNDNLNQVVLVQAVAAVPIFVLSAVVVRRREAADATARALLAFALLVLAALWLLYLPAFWDPMLEVTGALGFLARYNSYFDAFATSLLAFAMAMAVVEDTHRAGDQNRRQQLEALERSEHRLAEILRVAHDGILTLDADRRIAAVNRAASQIFGSGLVEGERFDRFLQPEERSAFWERLTADTRRSEAYPPVALRHEVVGLRSDGAPFPLELAVTSAEVGGGFVIVARDLTEQHREREERDRLQQQVAQTARLEAVGRMVSGVAHELNNPLTAIMAFAQDLQATARSEEDLEALTVIVQQAQRCRVIVGDLLIFSRSRRDERRRVEPADVVRRVVRVFEREATLAGLTLEVEMAPDLPPIEIDTVGIEQVLTNLLTNAFQATPRGGTVSLQVGPRDARLEFVVQDTGPGIPADVLPRLFEPFFTTKEQGRGTGLGLSVSHGIAQQHDGSLEAGPRPDGRPGARFVLRLPYVDRRSVDRTAGSDPAGPATVPPPPGRRVLVVDDESAIRSAIRRALERRGWQVDEAADGHEAMLRLEVGGRAADFDAVVTDLRMPGLSGIELYRQLAAAHPRLAERVVIISGDTASQSVADFLATTTRPFLQKPFDLRTLADLLERIASAAERE